MERAATHSIGRAVASQMASVFEMPMSKAILPPEVRIGALQDVDERRVVLECGTAVVVNSRTESVEPEFPLTGVLGNTSSAITRLTEVVQEQHGSTLPSTVACFGLCIGVLTTTCGTLSRAQQKH